MSAPLSWTFMRYGLGVWVVPKTGTKSGSPASSGQMNLNFLSRVTRMRNSSMRARPSPRHVRGPAVTNARDMNMQLTFCNLTIHSTKSASDSDSCHAHTPIEKGMKASGLTNSPWSLRKFSGWNSWWDFHCPSSTIAEHRLGMMMVPWRTNDSS